MKIRLSLVLFIALVAASTLGAAALDAAAQESKDNHNSAQAAEDLRAKLLEVQVKESELQARARQLDEDLKPENIERSLAGIGSTHPEELREQRRRELTIQRDGVRKQLDLLATSSARLESAIQTADNLAYQQSAKGFAGNHVNALRMYFVNPRRIVIASVTFLTLLAIGVLVAFIRRP